MLCRLTSCNSLDISPVPRTGALSLWQFLAHTVLALRMCPLAWLGHSSVASSISEECMVSDLYSVYSCISMLHYIYAIYCIMIQTFWKVTRYMRKNSVTIIWLVSAVLWSPVTSNWQCFLNSWETSCYDVSHTPHSQRRKPCSLNSLSYTQEQQHGAHYTAVLSSIDKSSTG